VPSSVRSRSSNRKTDSAQKAGAERAAADTAEELRRLSELRVRLALELVEAGFKLLCMRYHPDKGGSTETMMTLVNVRAELSKIIEEFYE
jgi:hypothetical protein